MKTDRELLELAAKAAGIVGEYVENKRVVADYGIGRLTGIQISIQEAWNPLEDDGDALRLAAALKIDIEWQATNLPSEPAVEAYRREIDAPSYCASEHENDYRRAIVRAAAGIGEKMP